LDFSGKSKVLGFFFLSRTTFQKKNNNNNNYELISIILGEISLTASELTHFCENIVREIKLKNTAKTQHVVSITFVIFLNNNKNNNKIMILNNYWDS
jgi:hypothetical protein